jgi:TPR repeat protein
VFLVTAGDGVEKNPEESMKLLEIAATRGNGRARGVLQQIMLDRMAKEQKQQQQPQQQPG